MMKYLSVFIVLVFLCGCASQQMAFHYTSTIPAKRARQLVPGMEAFWLERDRIAGSSSSLAVFDFGIGYSLAGHGPAVMEIARSFSFGPVQSRSLLDLDAMMALPQSSYIINISADLDSLNNLTLKHFTAADNVWVNAAGNSSHKPIDHAYRPLDRRHARQRKYKEFAAYVNSGLVIFVAGFTRSKGGYALHHKSARCGSAHGNAKLKTFCVLAPLGIPTLSGGIFDGTSSSAPVVAAILANARLLWPRMTSRQIVRLAQYCARPINPDGSLAAWGSILDENTASDIWGQGVLSTECFYDENNTLRNPMTQKR